MSALDLIDARLGDLRHEVYVRTLLIDELTRLRESAARLPAPPPAAPPPCSPPRAMTATDQRPLAIDLPTPEEALGQPMGPAHPWVAKEGELGPSVLLAEEAPKDSPSGPTLQGPTVDLAARPDLVPWEDRAEPGWSKSDPDQWGGHPEHAEAVAQVHQQLRPVPSSCPPVEVSPPPAPREPARPRVKRKVVPDNPPPAPEVVQAPQGVSAWQPVRLALARHLAREGPQRPDQLVKAGILTLNAYYARATRDAWFEVDGTKLALTSIGYQSLRDMEARG